ncbi:hypothetical protein EFL87_11010 [Weissella confusa]|nr:hypothetical protein [Weissella confusa]
MVLIDFFTLSIDYLEDLYSTYPN